MQTSWVLLVTNFTDRSATTGTGIMVCSNRHITPITQLFLCQCPTSLFNSLLVENVAIAHVMLSTANVTVVLTGIFSFFLSRI